MKRNIERFEHAAAGVEAGKISGAVGNFANIPPFVEKYVCDKLGIRAQEISTQVLPRDLHAEYFAVLASIATSIERMATEIRGLQKSEQREWKSSLPKVKRFFSNASQAQPDRSENMTGLARVSVVTWSQLTKMCHSGMSVISLTHQLSVSSHQTQPS